MAYIQSVTAEIRRGKKKERKKKEERNHMAKHNDLPYSIGRPQRRKRRRSHRAKI